MCVRLGSTQTRSSVAGMAGLREQDDFAARAKDAQRRAQELAGESAHLHDRVLQTAELVRRSHEQTAKTLEYLAAAGPAEHATRRRQMAERSHRFAEEEAGHITRLTKRSSHEPSQGGAAHGQPESAPT